MVPHILILAAALAPAQGAKGWTTSEIESLRRRREWLYDKTWEREDSGNFDWGEASPDGAFFPAGEADKLYYCSFFGGEDTPSDDRFYVTCWERVNNAPVRRWQLILKPGKEKVRGTLLRHAGGQTMAYTASRNGKTYKADIQGFHPDRASAQWKLAQPEMEKRQTLVHYHVNWHGDPSLGHYVDLHGDNNVQTSFQSMDPSGPSMPIPKAEIDWLRRRCTH